MKKILSGIFAAAVMTACLSACCAAPLTPESAEKWMDAFAEELSGLKPVNDPGATEDPAHPGSCLLEYEFGSVTSSSLPPLEKEQIETVRIDTPQVRDCRGLYVGASGKEAADGTEIPVSDGLHVLRVLNDGSGWCWAYGNENGTYAIEYIAYAPAENGMRKEYVLTYLISDGAVESIRFSCGEASEAQMQDSLNTAVEISVRQDSQAEDSERINGSEAVTQQDLQVSGVSLVSLTVDRLVSRLGEPVEVQELPSGGGRLLLYEGAVFEAGMNAATSEEIIRSVSVTGMDVIGPRGLHSGMGSEEVLALFRCSQDPEKNDGWLYLEGEAAGEPPCGRMTSQKGGTVTISYLCETDSGRGELTVIISSGEVSCWKISLN